MNFYPDKSTNYLFLAFEFSQHNIILKPISLKSFSALYLIHPCNISLILYEFEQNALH